jgi:cytochrome c556
MHTLTALSLATALALPLAAAAQEKEPPKDPVIAYRTEVMKSLGANAAALGAIMQKKVAYDQNIAIHAEAISLGARAALKAFEPKLAGGTAKAEIWDNWKDFSDRLKALDAAAADVAKTARDSGPAAAQPKVMPMFTCKGCHDTYRTK